MQIEEFYAREAIEASRKVVFLRERHGDVRAIRYHESRIQTFALYLMENLVLSHIHDADEAIQNEADDL